MMKEVIEPPRRKIPSWLPQALGYTLSAVCLLWVLHGYDLREIVTAVRSLDWGWVTIGVAADLLVYVVHGWRWNVLLSPLARLPLWRTVQSIYIGLFANEVLPLRTGELIRCYLLSHWRHIHLSLVFASAAVERVIDGFWMVVAFVITASFLELPRYLVDLVQVLGVLMAIAIGLLVYVIVHKSHAQSVVKESRWAASLRHLVEGLHAMGSSRSFAHAIAVSLLYMLLQVVSYWALIKAYDLDLSIWAAAAVLSVVRFGTVVPNAPGNVGLFQASCVLALKLFDVDQTEAKTFSFVLFFALTLPLLIGGAIAVLLTGLNITEIRTRARRGLQHAHPAPVSPAPENPAQ
jgi:hypothetical protein